MSDDVSRTGACTGPKQGALMRYDWSWGVFLDLSPDGLHTNLEMLLVGAGWTVALSLSSWTIALLLGTVVGILRTTGSAVLRALGATYVEVFRNIPLIVQMFLWYFVLPELLPVEIGSRIKEMPQPWAQFVPALLCLSLYGTARVAEQVRSGIQSLARGQFGAGIALGLTEPQVYVYVILPQAFRIIIPPLSSEFMGAVKYSAVAMTIGLLELTGQARAMQEDTFHIFEAFAGATVIYLLMNGLVVAAVSWIERRATPPGDRHQLSTHQAIVDQAVLLEGRVER